LQWAERNSLVQFLTLRHEDVARTAFGITVIKVVRSWVVEVHGFFDEA
jgi:hypothetical protein